MQLPSKLLYTGDNMAQIQKMGIYPDINSFEFFKAASYTLVTPELLEIAESTPSQIGRSHLWIFKRIVYKVSGAYTEDQIRLLVIDEFDKERRKFEKLKHKYETGEKEETYKRTPIPEAVRIEVWRRDGGKCVKCGSRENLEYDHIIPVSKGGGNTARNIELLCESCNRSKGAKIR